MVPVSRLRVVDERRDRDVVLILDAVRALGLSSTPTTWNETPLTLTVWPTGFWPPKRLVTTVGPTTR